MPPKSINTVFQVVVEAKLCYAGLADTATRSRSRKDRGLLTASVGLGYRSVDSPAFDHVISMADDRLFERVSIENSHPLHLLLPAERNQQYN